MGGYGGLVRTWEAMGDLWGHGGAMMDLWGHGGVVGTQGCCGYMVACGRMKVIVFSR